MQAPQKIPLLPQLLRQVPARPRGCHSRPTAHHRQGCWLPSIDPPLLGGGAAGSWLAPAAEQLSAARHARLAAERTDAELVSSARCHRHTAT